MMACRLIGTKPLSELILAFLLIDQLSGKIKLKYNDYHKKWKKMTNVSKMAAVLSRFILLSQSMAADDTRSQANNSHDVGLVLQGPLYWHGLT